MNSCHRRQWRPQAPDSPDHDLGSLEPEREQFPGGGLVNLFSRADILASCFFKLFFNSLNPSFKDFKMDIIVLVGFWLGVSSSECEFSESAILNGPVTYE